MKSIKLPSWISRALGARLRAAPPHAFALGEGRLSYARFAHQGKGVGPPVLEEAHYRKLPDNLFGSGPVGGPIRDQDALEKFIVEFVGELSAPVPEASLVVPDKWARLVFLEVADIPKTEPGRTEMLSWKLKQEVPFRVEDLRVRGVEVLPLEDQVDPRRLLVGFGAEQLFSGIEAAFAKASTRIGHIANRSMSFAEAATSGKGGEAFLWGSRDGYSLVVLDDGEPVLFRSKQLAEDLGGEVVRGMVERELRLTLGFLAKRRSRVVLEQVVVAAEEEPEFWLRAAHNGVSQREGAVVETPVVQVRSAIAGRVEVDSSRFGDNQWIPLFGAAQRFVT